jgi:hypothetical protein
VPLTHAGVEKPACGADPAADLACAGTRVKALNGHLDDRGGTLGQHGQGRDRPRFPAAVVAHLDNEAVGAVVDEQ